MNIEKAVTGVRTKQQVVNRSFSAEMNGFSGLTHYQQQHAISNDIHAELPSLIISDSGQIACPRELQELNIQ